MNDNITIPRSTLLRLFNTIVEAMEVSYDWSPSDDGREALVAVAGLLGVEVARTLPSGVRCAYRESQGATTIETIHNMSDWREDTFKKVPLNPCLKCGRQAVEHTPDPEDSRKQRMICMSEDCRHVWYGVPDRGDPRLKAPVVVYRYCMDCGHDNVRENLTPQCVNHDECAADPAMGRACYAAQFPQVVEKV